MWNMRRSFNPESLPPSGLVLYTEIIDARLRCWWFVIKEGEVDLCWDDPGFDVDISLYVDLLTLVKIFIGELSLARTRTRQDRDRWAKRSYQGHVELVSPQQICR